jgi:hypothetical protein
MRAGDLARQAVAPVVRRVPLETWPRRLGDLYGIKVPKGVVALPELSARGSAHVGLVLDLLARTRSVPGAIAECGVYRGSTLVPIALESRRHHGGPVLGFDSFRGFDETVEIDVRLGGAEDGTRRLNGFDDTSIDLVQRKLHWLGLEATVRLVPGPFAETLPRYADRAFSFVHLDCDLYQSYRDCLESFWPRLSPGGIVLFDEYDDPSWPGCNLAVDEFVTAHALTLEHTERDNYRRFFLVKPRD